MSKIYTAIGLMSGTSMDGIDAAIIKTDGQNIVERMPTRARCVEYSNDQREMLVSACHTMRLKNATISSLDPASAMITQKHGEVVQELLKSTGIDPSLIDVIGFHGQTVLHRPDQGVTIQIGDGQKLADTAGICVVSDMRGADIKAGGQGAPLVPIYHQALVKQAGLELPVAVLNVGGVANVTYIGEPASNSQAAGQTGNCELIAFDTGPGNALINDWVNLHGAGEMDKGGKIAAKGSVKESVLSALLNNSYFSQEPPKSLDRNHFSHIFARGGSLEGMSIEEGAMTLTSFTALAASRAEFFFPAPPKKWIICGGGARNPVLMAEFQKHLSGEVMRADDLGWSSDYMEAEAFAYLAVRSLRGLPLTFPGTTGVLEPFTGGVLHKPQG